MGNVTSISSNIEEIQYNKPIYKGEKLNIALYLIAKTTSLLGTDIYNFALSLYILRSTGSGSSFAANVLIGILPKVVLGPFAGILADRTDRKKLTVIFDIFSGFTVFVLLGLSSAYGLKVIFIYAANLILSTINVFYDTSMTSSMPNLVGDEKLIKINSYTAVSSSLSALFSPVLAGIIYGFVPVNLFLVINGISFLFSSAMEIFIDFNLNKPFNTCPKAAMTLDTFKEEFKEVLNFVKGQKVMYSLLKYILMINLFFGALLNVVYPYVINKFLNMSSAQFGIFQGSYFFGMIAFSIIMANKKEKDIKIRTLSIRLAAIGLIFILIGIPTVGLDIFKIKIILSGYNIILLFTIGAVLITINTPVLVSLQRLTPDNLRGRITGALTTLTGGFTPLGIILSGLIVDKVHPFLILSVSGLCVILSAMNMMKIGDTKLY